MVDAIVDIVVGAMIEELSSVRSISRGTAVYHTIRI